MSGAPGSGPRWRLWVGAFAAGVALAIGAGLALRTCNRGDGAPPEPVQATAEPKPLVTPNSLDRPLEPGETLELARVDFPAEGPVRVVLWLPEPSTDAEPRPVRMFSLTDQRGLQTQGVLDASRTRATFEL